MFRCDPETAVPEWVIEHPESLGLFRELGIDYTCGGKSLEYACRERGLEVRAVLAALARRIAPEAPPRPESAKAPTADRPQAASVPVARLESLQVGRPQSYGRAGAPDPMDRPWTTGFFKEPVAGPLWLGTLNLEGDGQADRAHHGGPEKAVLAYAAAHYPAWRAALNLPALPHGAFGENFTLSGLTEAEVCLGDTWQVGEQAVVQVSQPRQPCWKLARRWRIKSLAARVQQTGRTGWYFRVLVEGPVAAGMPLALLERPHAEWSVARANQVMHGEKHNPRAAAELAAVPLLSANWRETLTRRAEQGLPPDSTPRLLGENE